MEVNACGSTRLRASGPLVVLLWWGITHSGDHHLLHFHRSDSYPYHRSVHLRKQAPTREEKHIEQFSR